MTDNFEFFDKKFIILLVLDESNSYLSIDQIAKMCSDFEDITYFDICEYIDSLVRRYSRFANVEINENNDGYIYKIKVNKNMNKFWYKFVLMGICLAFMIVAVVLMFVYK